MKALIESPVQVAASLGAGTETSFANELTMILTVISNCDTFASIRKILINEKFTHFVYGTTETHMGVKQINTFTGKVFDDRFIFVTKEL